MIYNDVGVPASYFFVSLMITKILILLLRALTHVMPLLSTLMASNCRILICHLGSLSCGRNENPTIPCHVTNSLAVTALHSAWSSMVQLILVALRQAPSIYFIHFRPSNVGSHDLLSFVLLSRVVLVTSFPLPFVVSIPCNLGSLTYVPNYRFVSHSDFCLVDSNSLNSVSNSLSYNLLNFHGAHSLFVVSIFFKIKRSDGLRDDVGVSKVWDGCSNLSSKSDSKITSGVGRL
ncbi:hypothetical protein Tco_0714171 [Tanacetum coccineum]